MREWLDPQRSVLKRGRYAASVFVRSKRVHWFVRHDKRDVHVWINNRSVGSVPKRISL